MLMTCCCQVQDFENLITQEDCGGQIPNLKDDSEIQKSPPTADTGSTAFPISHVVGGFCLINFLNIHRYFVN